MTSALRALAVAALLAGGVARGDGYLETPYRLTTLLSLGWEAGIPVRGLRQWVNEPSYRGLQFEVRFGVARHLSLGLASSWSWFAQNAGVATTEIPNATVSGPLYRRARFITLRGTGHWYLTDGPLQPYLGAGVGAASHEWYRAIGDFVQTGSGWSAVADPQVGLLWTVSRGLALHLQAHYQYTLATFAGVRHPQWAGVQVGLAVY